MSFNVIRLNLQPTLIYGMQFQLRYSPSISQKPRSAKPQDGRKPIDPFLQPPEALLIADLGDHILVLNKFAIVPEHFILATKEFKEQTNLLEEEDLGVAYACIRAWRDEGNELFAFFNSGEHSGASQPHRHLQFLPVNSMMSGVMRGDWSPLVDKLTLSPKLG
jgi:sulfate adenylyltransferase (ADP) / ATP adenylyltransferase